jgi:hypothetical protein
VLPFLVHITDADRAYLAGLPLSDTARERVEDFIDYAIAGVDDAFRNDCTPTSSDRALEVTPFLLTVDLPDIFLDTGASVCSKRLVSRC